MDIIHMDITIRTAITGRILTMAIIGPTMGMADTAIITATTVIITTTGAKLT